MAILQYLGLSRLLASCLLLALSSGAQEPVEPAPEASQWYALLVGCDEYPNLKESFPERYENEYRLLGPANDVALMREVLIDSLHVPPDHITTLVGGWEPEDKKIQPTRKNIRAKLLELEKDVKEANLKGQTLRVVLYFSGHGSQQHDSDRPGRDSEPDGLDEVFLPADVGTKGSVQGRIPNAMADDELGRAARDLQAAGAQVWMIFDCCHAATMARGGPRSRSLDPALFGLDIYEGTRGTLGPEPTLLTGQTLGNIVAMYASRSDARAPEMPLPLESEDAKPHGLFTWTLVEQLRQRGEAWTFRDLFGAVLEAYERNGDIAESLPVAEGGMNLSIETGLAESTLARWYLVADKLPTPRHLQFALLGPDGKALPPGPARDAVVSTLAPFGDRLEIVDVGPEVARVTLDEAGLWIQPGGKGQGDLMGVAVSDLTQRLGGLDLLRVAQKAVADDWAEPLGDVRILIERKAGGRGKLEALEAGDSLHPGDSFEISLIKPAGAIYDINVLHVGSDLEILSLYPPQGLTPRLGADVSEPVPLYEGTVVDPPLGLEHLIVFAVPREAGDPETNLVLRELDAVPRVGVVTIVTEWPSVGPPHWPRRVVELTTPLTGAPHTEVATPTDPWAIDATHAALAMSRGGWTLLLGDADGPRYAFVGNSGQARDPQALVQDRSFEAYAVFHYFPDRRIAFYASGSDGLDLVLIDKDLDGIADVQCERTEGEGWRVRAPVVLPWLSQGYLPPWQGKGKAPNRFSALVR